uniref:Uncharacterized protein n=1 Tax=Nelumbo nucifera TaxID=4432 RepID=A0A822Y7M7_NELNU|nr:TPA_asm: hypothetical protein HUJ06_029049 [Nelumbo nucifera]
MKIPKVDKEKGRKKKKKANIDESDSVSLRNYDKYSENKK